MFGRILVGLVIVGIVFVMLRGTFIDIQKNTPPPIQRIMRAEARFSPDGKVLQVLNTNDFAWPKPKFSINGSFRYDHTGVVPRESAIDLQASWFKKEDGTPFGGASEFNRLDIDCATMCWDHTR